MPLLGNFEQENLYSRMQETEFRRQCQEIDGEIAGITADSAPDPELEALFRFFDREEERS